MANKTQQSSRRLFLKKSAGFAVGVFGFLYVIRSSALGLAGAVSFGNRLLTAQIGCGNMRPFLEAGQDVQVVAVCDVDARHAQERKQMVDDKYGNQDCRTYHDFRELLERESLDVVSHALPDHRHAPVTIACARKGLDMYGEKPFARTIGEGRAMCRAIQQYGLIWQTGSWQRSVSDFRQAAELVRNRRIGTIKYVEVGLYKSQNHHRNFIDGVKSCKETIALAETAHRSIGVGLLGEIAMLTGRKLRWNPDTETFIDDDDANRYLMRSYRGPWYL